MTGFLHKVWDVATDVGHALTGIPTADEKRNQQKAVNEQISAYKEQTALTKSEIERKRGEEKAEKRKINEKQIRSLRRNYRPASFLSAQDSGEVGMSSKLGG